MLTVRGYFTTLYWLTDATATILINFLLVEMEKRLEETNSRESHFHPLKRGKYHLESGRHFQALKVRTVIFFITHPEQNKWYVGTVHISYIMMYTVRL